jgi:membrane-bound serine protease (ClpP class)
MAMRVRPVLLLAMLWGLALPMAARAETAAMHIVKVSDAIGPGVADFITQAIDEAESAEALGVVIQLDTPGGLAESMRDIVMRILASRLPVVVYVAPGGARAASAGVMITMAADVAAMAPGTNIGAAHPVGAGGKDIDSTMGDKVVNDMVAHARSVAERRGRNADWVEKAIRESVAVTETEALRLGIIDLVADDLDDLLEKIDGRTIPGKGILKTRGANRLVVQETLRTKVLKTLSDPNIAYILMMIGLAGIYFELSHPGAIFPGAVGGICLVLAFFAFQTLPINYAGFLLIALAVVFFILEMKIASFGLLSLAGIVSLVLGSLMLFKSSDPAMRLSWSVILPTVAMVSGFCALVAGLVFRAQIAAPRTGDSGLLGEQGVVKSALTPYGKVFVHGELWNARADTHLSEGARVRVVGVKGLVLTVEALAGPER